MKNYYISTIDRIPVMMHDGQLVFAPDGVVLKSIAYTSLKELRDDQTRSAEWRQSKGFDNLGRHNYWRIKL
jgi:hypothetical protein